MALILFDYDGVLADTLHDLLKFGQEVCDELGVKHTATTEDLNTLEVMSFTTYGRQLEVPETLVDEFVRRSLEKFALKASPPEIFYGLAEVVRELSTQHVLGIVTTNSTQNVRLFLKEHNLEECFRMIHGVDSPGTKTEKIVRSQNQFGAEKEAVYMIGDALSDIRAAQQAGVRSVAVDWGHQSLEQLKNANPDVIVHAPQELRSAIETDMNRAK